jgi:hypothetical protein
VELLDKYFGSVCELDIIFNFEKAYFMWDEFVLGGDVQETSKKNVLKAISDQDMIQEVIYYACILFLFLTKELVLSCLFLTNSKITDLNNIIPVELNCFLFLISIFIGRNATGFF